MIPIVELISVIVLAVFTFLIPFVLRSALKTGVFLDETGLIIDRRKTQIGFWIAFMFGILGFIWFLASIILTIISWF